MIIFLNCNGAVNFDLSDLDLCDANSIEDILGTWYETSSRASTIHPNYHTIDSTIWILERIPLDRGETSMDSLQVIKEYHPGDIPFDPNKHTQKTYRLKYYIRSDSKAILNYGTAEFSIPACDSLKIKWVDKTIHYLKRKGN